MAVKRLSLAIFNNEMKIRKRNKVYMVSGEKNDYQTQQQWTKLVRNNDRNLF